MRTIILWPLVAAALLGSFSCDCPPMYALEEEQLQSPFRVEEFYVDGVVVLFFNKPVDSASVIGQKTLLIGGATTKYTGYFELSPDHLQITIPSCEIYCNAPQQNCPFTLRLDGDPADGLAIRSKSGQILDGDDSGSDGGDYYREEENGSVYDCGLYSFTVDSSLVLYSPPNSPNSKVLIEVVFSTNVDTSSVHAGDNVYLECGANPGIRESGSIVWLRRNKMRFIADKDRPTLFSLCLVGDFASYNFVIKGTAPNPVNSVYNTPLNNGADYVFKFFM